MAPSKECRGYAHRLAQYDEPNWQPLLDVAGERITGTFMWMHEEALEDGSRVHAYKHIETRDYLYLSASGDAFELAPCGRLVPLRLDLAIERAVCSWWLLERWEEEDRVAIRDVVLRAQERAQPGW